LISRFNILDVLLQRSNGTREHKNLTTFSIENFGCRATQSDAAAIERELRFGGLARVREHAAAEIVVLNTCTVTAAADAQARDAIRHVHAANPGARILVSGCYAQRAPEELAELPRTADLSRRRCRSAECPNS
jgi:threonylcarbamoyladenosine tRNA methylthiotransferase MtaB